MGKQYPYEMRKGIYVVVVFNRRADMELKKTKRTR